MEPRLTENTSPTRERVCDHCMVKKTKCNRQKPACSRCLENSWNCTYTTKRRKPGPPKGSRPKRHQSHQNSLPGAQRGKQDSTASRESRPTSSTEASLATETGPSPNGVASSIPSNADVDGGQSSLHAFWRTFRMIDVQNDASSDHVSDRCPRLSPEVESELLERYFECIQPYYPLFRKHDLLYQYYTDQLPSPLLAAIFAVSVSLTSNQELLAQGTGKIGEVYADFVKRACTPHLLSDVSATITDLRTIFLLALYEFRKNPNQRAWTVMSQLVRLAYQYGLHQVDNPTNCSFYQPDSTSAEELEAWRYLWWSIFTLDTCCTTTTSTPSIIDIDSLCTALPAGTIQDWTNGDAALSPLPRTFLFDELEVLLNHLKALIAKWMNSAQECLAADVNFTVRIVNTAQLREICKLSRASDENPTRNVEKHWQRLSTHTAALRLVLPTRYLNPQRIVSSGESKHSHASRLVNLLEISISNLLATMPKSVSKVGQDQSWSADWDASIAYANQVVEIVKHWNPGMLSYTDPAVGYIVFVAMIMIHINRKLDTNVEDRQDADSINHSSFQLLKLFLEQLSSQWHLPRALVYAAERFRSAAKSPISRADASHILRNLRKPLHIKPRAELSPVDKSLDQMVQQSFQDTDPETNVYSDWFDLFDNYQFAYT